MAFLFKKKKEEELPPFEGLPPLPPLPGEEAAGFPQPQRLMPPPPEFPPFPKPQEARVAVPERATVFVRVDKYKEIMQTIESMQRKVDELQNTLNKIAAIKEKEAEIIHGWGAMLQETKSKVDEVNAKLLRPSEA